MTAEVAGRRAFHVVLGLNLTDTASSGLALEQGARIASRIEPSQVHAVCVMPEDTSDALVAQAAGRARAYVDEKVASLGVSGPVYAVHVRRGDPAREIAQVAADLDADMVVVGTHKVPELKTLFIGSTASRVMAHTTCPVVVAGPRPKPEASHVIVIEPPCPQCVARRVETANRVFWCDRHLENHHLRGRHVYSYASDVPFGESDMSVDPRGG